VTSLDYSAILLAILALCGLILLVDRFVLQPRRAAVPTGTVPAENSVVSLARTAFPVLLIVLLFRSFLFEPFRIPSASMMPLLEEGDFILVNKFNYGLRLPVLNTKILATGSPQRGDVIVFHSTSGPPINLIKRLVGLPGDHIIVRDNHLSINGAAVALVPDGEYSGEFGFTGAPLEKETFGRSDHVIMLAQNRYASDFDGIVPPKHYFFMGDNRNDSEDSRFAEVGFVPEDHLVGHAIRIWMNWRIPGWPHLRRIGTPIR
jgi:signal peptidase I